MLPYDAIVNQFRWDSFDRAGLERMCVLTICYGKLLVQNSNCSADCELLDGVCEIFDFIVKTIF